MKLHLDGVTYDVLARWYAGMGDPLYTIVSAFALGTARCERLDWDESGTHFVLDATPAEVRAVAQLMAKLMNGAGAQRHECLGTECPECTGNFEDETWALDMLELWMRFPPPAPEEE